MSAPRIMALSLWQPWATLMAVGAKGVETRSWPTSYRGWVAIHATATARVEGNLAFWEPEVFGVLSRHGYRRPIDLPYGAILALGQLCRVFPTESFTGISEQERAFGNYQPGRRGWVFSDIIRLPEPIPCKGARGLWVPPPAVSEALARVVTTRVVA